MVEVQVLQEQKPAMRHTVSENHCISYLSFVNGTAVMSLEVLFGWTASLLCTFILVPQIIKTFKTRQTDDVSMYMLIISVVGNAFWVAHAALTHNIPLIVGAGLISAMSIVLIIFKYLYDTK